MASKIIGFAGIEVIDTVMYLSRICHNFGDRVLILDYSYADEMECCIPNNVDMDASKQIIDYRGIDFTKKIMNVNELKSYDVVLMNFGFAKDRIEKKYCTHFIYTTDLQKAHIKKLISYPIPENVTYQQLVLIGKESKDNCVKNYLNELKGHFENCSYFNHRYDNKDAISRCLCEFCDRFTFDAISIDFKEYLYEFAKMLYPDTDKKKFRLTMKKAERGM